MMMQPNLFGPPVQNMGPPVSGLFQPGELAQKLYAIESNTEPPKQPTANIFANATVIRSNKGANVIGNQEDVDHELHSQQEFGERNVLQEVQMPGNRSVAHSSPKQKKMQSHQLRQRNAKLAKQGAVSNPLLAQGVENTRRLFQLQL